MASGTLGISHENVILDSAELCFIRASSSNAGNPQSQKALRRRKRMSNGARLNATSWFGTSVCVTLSWFFKNAGTDRGTLPRSSAFPAMLRETFRHADARNNCPNIFRVADSNFREAL
jgi:hypothetical protein